MASPIEAIKVQFDKYGFILAGLLIVTIFDIICILYKIQPSDIVAIDGILVSVIGYGVLEKVAASNQTIG